MAQKPKVFNLWGGKSSGKTHLLNATLNRCSSPAIYLPLKEMKNFGQRLFDNLDRVEIIALDDIDVISGDKEFETSLFYLLNKVILSKRKIIVTSQKHPSRQGFELSDLVSRLCSGLLYKVYYLANEEMRGAIKFLFSSRGMNISSGQLDYIFKYYPRDMENLIILLDKLDEVSLSKGKPISIPMIKKILLELNGS